MIFDFRNSECIKQPIIIKDSSVEQVSSYKYLGVTIQSNLKWDIHVHNLVKKANKIMHLVYSLYKLHVDCKLISLFYNAVVSTVLSYAMSCWYAGCTNEMKKDVRRFHKKICKLCPTESIPSFDDIFSSKCSALCTKIMKDSDHPLHQYFKVLKHHDLLNVIYCRTNRFKNTFVPAAIAIYNKK